MDIKKVKMKCIFALMMAMLLPIVIVFFIYSYMYHIDIITALIGSFIFGFICYVVILWKEIKIALSKSMICIIIGISLIRGLSSVFFIR